MPRRAWTTCNTAAERKLATAPRATTASVPRLITAADHLGKLELGPDQPRRAVRRGARHSALELTHADDPARALSVNTNAAHAPVPRILGTTGKVTSVADPRHQ